MIFKLKVDTLRKGGKDRWIVAITSDYLFISQMASPDLVAQWQVPLSDGVHLVEFEHGTTTGKRVIRVNGRVS